MNYINYKARTLHQTKIESLTHARTWCEKLTNPIVWVDDQPIKSESLFSLLEVKFRWY